MERSDINIYLRMIFLLAPLSFSTGQITLRELPFCIACQFRSCASLPASQLSSSISFLCCTGAEHYVNLVIGTGPSPLYGFLLSRSTWLVKEDGMKINEVQLIQEEGGYLSNTSTEEIAETNNSLPPAQPFLSTPFFILPVLTRELWTFHLCSKATTASWFDWCRYSSQSFPFELKGPALQNRFSSTIHTGCQQIEWQGSPLCGFI